VNRLVRRLLLTLLIGAIVAAALVQLTSAPLPRGVMQVRTASFIKSDEPAPPDLQAPWVTRSLPDNWARTNPGQSGYGWYRAEVVLPQAPVDEWAAYLPTVATTHRLFINGVDVGGGEMTGPFHRQTGTPQLNVIPPHLLQAGSNELLLRLRVAPNLRGGLGMIVIGPKTTIEPLYDRDLLVRVTLPRSLNIALVFVGLLVLLLWLRRPTERIYGVFAALALVWSLRNFHYTVAPPMPSSVWEAFILASLALVNALNWTFMLHYTGKARPRLERWLLLGAAASLPLLAVLPPLVVSALRLPWYVACAAFGVWTITLLVQHLRSSRPDESGPWIILGAMVITLLLGLTDFAVSAQWLPFGPAARMSYGAPLLLCALVYALAESYFRTYDEARALNAQLEQRVQERARQLEETHERLRALEHATIVAGERERLMRDMHDGIGSQLITTLEAVERGTTDAREVAGLLRECMDDLRLMIDSLEPDAFALQAALGNLRYRLEPRLRAAGIALQWQVDDAASLPSGRPALQVLRIVQEAITNVLKHAGATELRFACLSEAGDLVLRIADNGRGLPAVADGTHGQNGQNGQNGRRGLGNMQLRAQQLQGSLRMASGAAGTQLTLRVPLAAIAAAANTPLRG
jgi:signal transduction histidine kinase